jgi:hypothetical protein
MDRPLDRVPRTTPWVTMAAAGLLLAAGCSADNSGPPQYDEEEPDRLQRDPYAGSPGGYADPAAPPQSEPREWENARLRVEGKGEDFKFKAPRDGMVYVVDSRDRKLLYRTQLDQGEEINVSPFRDVIEIDGQRVKRVDMNNQHRIRIFFERD